MSETLTVTRALAELKHLEKCINKQITQADFITLITKANKASINQDAFTNNCKAQYQSTTDLITRYNKIKSAIILNNATTQVVIGKQSYSVAEVIERRRSMGFYKSLLEKMKSQRENANRTFALNNQQMEQDLQRLLEQQFSGTSKTNSSEIENIATPFRETRKSTILDPLNITPKITDLEQYIADFDNEANFILSESNALTKITL